MTPAHSEGEERGDPTALRGRLGVTPARSEREVMVTPTRSEGKAWW